MSCEKIIFKGVIQQAVSCNRGRIYSSKTLQMNTLDIQKLRLEMDIDIIHMKNKILKKYC